MRCDPSMDRALRLLLWASALVNLGWGLMTLFAPMRAAEILHLEPTSGRGFSELRAVYGGGVGMLGVLTVLALRRPDGGGWLTLMGLAFVGLATGRLVSLFGDSARGYSGVVLALELGFAGLLLFAATRPLFPDA